MIEELMTGIFLSEQKAPMLEIIYLLGYKITDFYSVRLRIATGALTYLLSCPCALFY